MIWAITAKAVFARNGHKVQGTQIPRTKRKIGPIRLNFHWFSRYRATSKVRKRRVLLSANPLLETP
jgi:hypothetical protein